MAKLLPQMAKRETIMFRYIKKFHEQFQSRLGSDALETLRACAWQIEDYLDEHGKYKDAEFLRTLQQSIEWVIQKKCGTDWSVERAKRDLRGRTRGINQFAKPRQKLPRKRAPVSSKLSQAITDRVLDIPRREFD